MSEFVISRSSLVFVHPVFDGGGQSDVKVLFDEEIYPMSEILIDFTDPSGCSYSGCICLDGEMWDVYGGARWFNQNENTHAHVVDTVTCSKSHEGLKKWLIGDFSLCFKKILDCKPLLACEVQLRHCRRFIRNNRSRARMLNRMGDDQSVQETYEQLVELKNELSRWTKEKQRLVMLHERKWSMVIANDC